MAAKQKAKKHDWYCTCPGHLPDVDHNLPDDPLYIESYLATGVLPPSRSVTAVGARNKWWATGAVLRIGFMGGTVAQRNMVKQYAAKWLESANLEFTYPAAGPYDMRVAFVANGGAWSYVGTDCRQIGQNSPTMNLGWLGEDVIQHEFGHGLGLLHEQQFPGGVAYNEPNVIQDLSGPPNNWTIPQIRFNVLDAHQLANVILGTYDQTSIMHYPIPARWTMNGVAIAGGKVISAQDHSFIATRYPGRVAPTTNVTITGQQADQIVTLLNARLTEIQTNAARMSQTLAEVRLILNR